MDLNELLERRARAYNSCTEITQRAAEEKRDLTSDERETFDKAAKDVESLTTDIRRAEQLRDMATQFGDDDLDKPFETPGDGITGRGEDELYARAFDRFMRFGANELDAEERNALRTGYEQVNSPELRALGVGTGSAGGYFVPAGFRNRVTEAQLAYGNVRRVSEVIETETGNDLPWPSNDDTANEGAIVAENIQVTEQDLTLGTDTLKAYLYSSKLVRVSIQLLQDNVFDLDAWLPRKLGERVARINNRHFTTGTGTAQPQGVVTGATSAVTAAGTGDVTYGELLTLKYAVDSAYRESGRVRWMMNDASIGSILGLLDGNDRPIWQPAITQGAPDTLLGHPIESNNHMPTMAAGNKAILFGDFFAYYVIREVRGFQLLRLAERYADYFQVGFLGFNRVDGQVQDVGAVKALTMHA